MAHKKQPAFLLPKNKKEIIDDLSDEEAGIIFKSIYQYEHDKTTPKLDKFLTMIFKQFRIELDENDKKYEETCLKNKENIENYWKKKKEDTTEYDRIRSNTMATNKIKEKKIKENKIKINKNSECVINNTEPSAQTHTPTLEEVIDFGTKLGMKKQTCKKFYSYYSANNWNNVVNWQAKLEYWFMGDEEKEIKNKEVTTHYETV